VSAAALRTAPFAQLFQIRVQMLMTCYQGQLFEKTRDAGAVFDKRTQGRLAMREAATPAAARDAARRIVVHPCRSRYTLVTTTADSFLARTLAAVQERMPTVVTVLMGVVAVGAYFMWRSRARR
jgi:hypothetical protein